MKSNIQWRTFDDAWPKMGKPVIIIVINQDQGLYIGKFLHLPKHQCGPEFYEWYQDEYDPEPLSVSQEFSYDEVRWAYLSDINRANRRKQSYVADAFDDKETHAS